MKASERSSHWENLAAQLGIKPGPVSRPQQAAAVPPPLIKKPAAPAKKTAPAQGNWDQLARTLGIDVPPRPPKLQPPATHESAIPSAADDSPSTPQPGGSAPQLQPSREERGRRDRGEREDQAKGRAVGERKHARSRPTAKAGWESIETDAGRAERSASARTEAAKVPARAWHAPQAADQASTDEPPERRRRRRRRRRKPSSGEGPATAAPSQQVSQPLDDEEDLTEVEFAKRAEEVWEPAAEPTSPPMAPPAGTKEPEPTRSKRRRRRRGRRREEHERAHAASPAKSAETEHHGEGDEQHITHLEPPDRDHATGGEHLPAQEGAAPPQATPQPELVEPAEEEDAEAESRPVYRGIPTWEETVGYIIQQNMEARARSPHAGGPRGRGNKGRGHGT